MQAGSPSFRCRRPIGPDFNYIKKRAPDYLWTYRDADGELLFYEMRFDIEGGEKEYYSLTRWRSRYDDELEGWRVKDLPRRGRSMASTHLRRSRSDDRHLRRCEDC